MYNVLTYSVSLFIIVLSVFLTLFFKSELERILQEKKDKYPFHICNVLITLKVSFAAHAVMTIYIIGIEFDWILQLVIHMFIILPIYILGHVLFEKYKSVYQKYITVENGKVIVLNEKYLKKKKWPSKFKTYNAISKEK